MKFRPMPSYTLDSLLLTDGQWFSIEGKFSFVIGYIKGLGYSASYKDVEYEGEQPVQYIEDSINKPFKTLQQAEAACRRKLKQLRLN